MPGFTVPNATDLAASLIASLDQSEPDALDFQVAGNHLSGVISGAAYSSITSASGNPIPGYLNVVMGASEVRINGIYGTIAGSTVVVTSAPAGATSRFDIICANYDAGTQTFSYTVVAGSGSGNNPVFPTLTDNQIPLYAIYVKSGFDTSFSTALLVDKRSFVTSNTARYGAGAPSSSLGTTGDVYVNTSALPNPRQSQVYVKTTASAWENLSEFAELTGAVTTSGGTATTITNGAVTSEKLGPTEVTAVRTGTPVTLALLDANKMIRVGLSSSVALPSNTSLAYPIGTNLHFMQTTADRVTLGAGAGATVNSSIGATIATRTQWSVATAIKIDTDAWIVFGDVAP
jgi:hypothetical protein